MTLRRVAVAAAAVGVAVSGCGAAARGQADGTVTGAIRFVGGPAGSHVERVAEAGRVRLVRRGVTVTTTHVRQGHRFRLTAPPGRYRLEGRSGDARCRRPTVTIRAGATTRAQLRCDIA
jgi:hypothetical protein